MIYLDYAANTPADEEVLRTFCDVSRAYIGNPNSPHPEGRRAKRKLDECTAQIAGLLGVKESEIIYTSGASESNNLALKGIAERYGAFGKHIITTYLEHSSVAGAAAALRDRGFEVDYVGLTASGQVDLEHLKRLLRDDTILVSVCCVDGEMGVRQDIGAIGALLSGRPHCFFHTDATQAVGKIPVPFGAADLVTFAPHKFFGLNGCGVLVRKESVMLEPQIHGGISTTPFRSGTPALGLAAATAKALSLAVPGMRERYDYVANLNRTLRAFLKRFPQVRVNSTERSVPFLLNFSIPGVRTEAVQSELARRGIYVSTKSACCAPGTVSRPVFALTKNRRAALSTLRVSLSSRTTPQEVEEFCRAFADCCAAPEK